MKTRILALIIMLALCLNVSCDSFGYLDTRGEVSVVIEDDGEYLVYKIDLKDVKVRDQGAMGIIIALSEREENPLIYKADDGQFGAYLTEIGSLSNNLTDGRYIMVYTSVKDDAYEGSPTVEYEGVTLYQSGVGISEMRMFSGGVLLFRSEKYGE